MLGADLDGLEGEAPSEVTRLSAEACKRLEAEPSPGGVAAPHVVELDVGVARVVRAEGRRKRAGAVLEDERGDGVLGVDEQVLALEDVG